MAQNGNDQKESGPVTLNPELDLALSDDQLLDLIEEKRQEYDAMMEKKKVKERAERMVEYWRGTNEIERKRGMPSVQYRNNIVHRDLATRVQNATSRMPDIVVMSPEAGEDPSVKDQSKQVEDWLGIRLDNDVTRRLAQGAVRDNHLKLRGIWAYRYDHFRKDAVIERLRPEDVILDATARIPEDGYTCDNMEFIGEWCEVPTATLLAQFPGKAEELLKEISREAKEGKKAQSSKVRYLKVTARVTKKDGDQVLVLVNSYNRILLSKGPHPYWDEREGSAQEFGMVPENELHPDIAAVLPSLGLEVPQKKPKRFNHFPFPRMPYSVFSGENVGDGPMDDTTVVEVSLPMQDIVNLRGDQITQVNNWSIPKIVISTGTMTDEKASNISQDPSEIITVELTEGQGVNDVFTSFAGEAASPALYNDLQLSISAMDAHFSTNPVTRGETVTQESGVSKQISREGDLSASDDIAQTMVQRCVEEAANWLVQLAKIYFDEPKAASAPGPDRSLRSASISSDLIPDNIQIVVKANAVDKMTMRNLAMNLVSSKGIDPYTLYQILDFPNPKEMAHLLADFLQGEQSGYGKYLSDFGVNQAEPADSQSEMATSATTPAPQSPPAGPQGIPPQGPPAPIPQP